MPKEKNKAPKHASPLEMQLKGDQPGASAALKQALKKKSRGDDGKRRFGGSKSGMTLHDDEEEGADDFDVEDGGLDSAGGGAGFLSSKMSRRVLDAAREQLAEDDDDAGAGAGAGGKKKVRFGVMMGGPAAGSSSGGAGPISAAVSKKKKGAAAGGAGRRDSDDDDSDHDDGEGGDEDDEVIEFEEHDEVALDEAGEYVDARLLGGMDAAQLASEEAILKRFMPDAAGERRTLADIIMEKLKEKEAEAEADAAGAAAAGMGPGGRPPVDPKLIEVYTEVGRFLSKYKSGKLPKVFKIIPGLSNWEEVLFLTNPETWTPHATYAATRIFASNFNPAKAQRFFNLILLPKCRDDIYYHKRLNFHLYLALKKATYKPAGFFKGIVLPLAAAGDCTLKEAIIFGSVVAKMSLPQIHSAAALVRLAGTEYNGAVSVLLKMLVNKKYTLPYLAVDAVVDHFAAFRGVAGPLPLVWHQCLLSFAQRYKGDFTADQKAMFVDLLRLHGHHAIAPEVRRELASAGCRGDAPSALPAAAAAAAAAPAMAAIAAARAPAAALAAAAAAGPAALILAGGAAAAGRAKSGKSKGGMAEDI